LAELNVKRGVEAILGNYVVEDAVAERGVTVHGVIYDIGTGKLRDLRCGNAGVLGDKGKGVEGADEEVEEGDEVRGNHGMLVFRDGGKARMAVR